MSLTLTPLAGVPLVDASMALPDVVLDALAANGFTLLDHDVVVVTGKIVSKAEGRWVQLADVEPTPAALRLADLTEKDARLVQGVLDESTEVIRARPGNLLVRHRLGYVSGMAGIDRSNIPDSDDQVLLLPTDPQASAERLRSALASRTGVEVGVVITDSHGRPFRIGNTGVALGAAGVEAVRYLEGEPDLYGRQLSGASVVPTADLLASAAMLMTGEGAEGTPLVLARGLRRVDAGADAGELIRPADRDLFAIPDRDYGPTA